MICGGHEEISPGGDLTYIFGTSALGFNMLTFTVQEFQKDICLLQWSENQLDFEEGEKPRNLDHKKTGPEHEHSLFHFSSRDTCGLVAQLVRARP